MTSSNEYPQYPGSGSNEPSSYEVYDSGETSGSSKAPAVTLDNPGSYTVSSAFSAGWDTFRRNMWPLVGGVLIMFALIMVFQIVGTVVNRPDNAGASVANEDAIRLVTRSFITSLPAGILSFLLGGFLMSSAVDALQGRKVTIKNFFRIPGFFGYLGLSILVSILTIVGVILFIIPGIIVAFLFSLATPAYFVDPAAGIITALKRSIGVVKNNVGSTILLLLATLAVSLLAAITIVGIIFAEPFVTIVQAAAFLIAVRGIRHITEAEQPGAYGYHPENDAYSQPSTAPDSNVGQGYTASETDSTDTPWQGYPSSGDTDEPSQR